MMWKKHIVLFLSAFFIGIFNHYGQSYNTITSAQYNSTLNKGVDSIISENLSPGSEYEYFLELLNKKTSVNLDYTIEVEKCIQQFLTTRRNDLRLYIGRSRLYFPIIESILDQYDLPLELKYVAVIESGLNPFAKSKSGAVGLWQFLYNTCSLVDLEVTTYIDDRRDIYKSTHAACRYLQYLYSTFNDWNLVLASYNGGPGEVRKAIERSGGKTNYWSLRPYLSAQASNYVPSFIAMNYLMAYYDKYKIEPDYNTLSFENTDTILINYALSFDQIAAIINLPVEYIEKLNPTYRKRFIPDLISPCVLVLPKEKINEFLQSESRIIGYKPVISDYLTLVSNAATIENRKKIIHIVERGEYFHKIAIKYNCTVENIKAWNNLNSMDVYPGQKIEIWVQEKQEL